MIFLKSVMIQTKCPQRFAEDAFSGVPVIHALMMDELYPLHLSPLSTRDLTLKEMRET
jgi:hypothetical protein